MCVIINLLWSNNLHAQISDGLGEEPDKRSPRRRYYRQRRTDLYGAVGSRVLVLLAHRSPLKGALPAISRLPPPVPSPVAFARSANLRTHRCRVGGRSEGNYQIACDARVLEERITTSDCGAARRTRRWPGSSRSLTCLPVACSWVKVGGPIARRLLSGRADWRF
jgi:hypothetical protein